MRYSTLRWFAGYPDPGFAEGPSRVNPLTGEIYDADIRFDAGMTRFFRREINEYVNPAGTPWMPWMEEPRKPFLAPWHNRPAEFCDLVGGAVRDAEFAFDLLTARGMDPQGPEANQPLTKSDIPWGCATTSARAPSTRWNRRKTRR